MPLSDAQIATAARNAGFTDVATAVAVALAENTTRDPTRIGGPNSDGSYDYGQWQINGSAHASLFKRYNWKDVNDNAKMAHAVFAEAGNSWSPWSAYKNGRYVLFLPRGKAAAGTNAPAVESTSFGTGDLGSAAGGVAAAEFKGLIDFGLFLVDPHNWWRVGVFLGGIALLIIALFKMTGDNKLSAATKTALSTAAKAAVVA